MLRALQEKCTLYHVLGVCHILLVYIIMYFLEHHFYIGISYIYFLVCVQLFPETWMDLSIELTQRDRQ